MAVESLSVDQTLTMLGRTPERIKALTAGLTPDQLREAPDPDGWSANDVLAHLRSCADVWGNCIAAILAQDRPTLKAIDPRTWIEKTDYREQAFMASLNSFRSQRSDLLAILESLAPESWLLMATVRGAGKPLERSVLDYARRLARHERTHIKQIERTAKRIRI